MERPRVSSLIALSVVAALATMPAVTAAPAGGSEAAADAPVDDLDLVDPFIGTGGGGGAFPGATMPFGMAQPSPNTTGARGGGYSYSASQITGFGLTHLSGPGCAAFGDAAFLPTSGELGLSDPANAQQSFSHDDESASPGAYSVQLGDGTLAELTATDRTAWQRYTFPAGDPGNVLVDLDSSFGSGVRDATARIVGDRTVEGRVTAGTFVWFTCNRSGGPDYTLHFVAEFDRPFSEFGTWTGGTVTPGSREVQGDQTGAYVRFAETEAPVTVKIGLSFTSLEGARANLAAETDGFDFDATRDAAQNAWRQMLGRVEITGGTPERRRTFYTALYHSLLAPTLFSDVDGSYLGFDDRVHRDPTYRHYTNFSMWDTYRTAHQLIDLVAPRRAEEMAVSLVDMSRQGGWVPKWPVANRYTNEMIGDAGPIVLADAWSKGLLPKQRISDAYQAMRRNAFETPAPSEIYEARPGLGDYRRLGYVGLDPAATGKAEDLRFGPSVTLEYAVADCALGLMARGLGRKSDADALMQGAQSYRNLIDPETGLIRPRFRDGSWLAPFDPTVRDGHKEGTSWQYTWLAPQDPEGLIKRLGGDHKVTGMLDSFFAYDALVAADDLAAAVDREWGPGDRYLPNNEMDLQAPFTYLWTNQPWKTAAVVRAAQTLYTTDPLGIPGNDDLGALSSWHVLTALGLYPYTAGTSGYVLTPPVFERAVIDLSRPYYQADRLEIEAPGAREGIQYVESVRINGHRTNRSYIDHDEIRKRLKLRFDLTDRPGRPWGTPPSAQPPSPCGLDRQASYLGVDLAADRPYVHSDDAFTVTATVRNEGPAPARDVKVTLATPDGWTARPIGQTTVKSLPAGATATARFGVEVASDVQLGIQAELRATASWKQIRPATRLGRDAVELVTVASPNLADYFNNVGITSDGQPGGGSFGGCCHYSADALAAAGLTRGAQVQVGDATLTWPDTEPGTPDNVVTQGQVVLFPDSAGATELAVVGSATGGSGFNVHGTATLLYADGSSEQVRLELSDYALNGGDVPPWPSNEIIAEMPYRLNAGGGRNNTPAYVFAQRIPLAEGKVLEAVQLPVSARDEGGGPGELHVFAIGVG